MRDGARETIGGMITDKTIKYTKNNKTMAFITVEDLAGTVEVVFFRGIMKNQRFWMKTVSILSKDEYPKRMMRQ
ncbi:MAG: OB-fold nucleic acid binding domain-containing protein [Lachnoclostridium sp.]